MRLANFRTIQNVSVFLERNFSDAIYLGINSQIAI